MKQFPHTSLYKQLLAACFPGLQVRSMDFAGGGSCRLFLVNGDTFFRFPHSDKAVTVARKEKELYDLLKGRLPLPVPCYEFYAGGCSGFPYPVAGYRALPGKVVAGAKLGVQAATQLGGFLRALHNIPPPASWPKSASLVPADAARDLFRYASAASKYLDREQWAWLSELFDRFMSSPAGRTPVQPRLIHGDVDHGNMLWDPASGLLTGVIDFEESRADDPALDFTPMLGEFGEEFYQAALSAYGGPADPYFEARVRFWSRAIVVHELGYGAGQGAQVHVENGLARLKKAIDGAPVIGGWVLVHTAAAREWRGMPGG